MRIFTTYKLKPGVPAEKFAEWSRTVDQPVCIAKPVCQSMSVYIVDGGNQKDLPAVVEVVEATSFEEWEAATSAPDHAEIMEQWNELADADSVLCVYGHGT